LNEVRASILDTELQKLIHFEGFTGMFPFVGRHYGTSRNPRILLIAESHYFPKDCECHLSEAIQLCRRAPLASGSTAASGLRAQEVGSFGMRADSQHTLLRLTMGK
jgi:hypothetical protein